MPIFLSRLRGLIEKTRALNKIKSAYGILKEPFACHAFAT
jgi:hypothetical protein